MSVEILTITLTAEQRKQILDATGKSITKLRIDAASTGCLSDKDLEQAAGGWNDGGITQEDRI